MSEIHHAGSEGDFLRQRKSGEEKEIPSSYSCPPSVYATMGAELETPPPRSRSPPLLTMAIRKTSIVSVLLVVLGFLLWCIMHTVRSIQQWQQPPPSAEGLDPFCWPVVEAYLLLIAYLSLFVTVTLFAFMIPSLIMTWIVTLVLTYLSSVGFGIGRERHRRQELVRMASGWAKDMSWTTLKSAIEEGKVFGGAAVLTLLVLPWVLGRSNIFGGQACH